MTTLKVWGKIVNIPIIMDEEHLNIKIKQEKLTPERVEPKDDIEKLLDSNLFRENEQEDCKKEIEPTK